MWCNFYTQHTVPRIWAFDEHPVHNTIQSKRINGNYGFYARCHYWIYKIFIQISSWFIIKLNTVFVKIYEIQYDGILLQTRKCHKRPFLWHLDFEKLNFWKIYFCIYFCNICDIMNKDCWRERHKQPDAKGCQKVFNPPYSGNTLRPFGKGRFWFYNGSIQWKTELH